MMKTMLITGGSGGIGSATATLAARHGYAVVVNYHQDEISAERTVSKIIESGGEAIALQADISKQAEVLRLFVETDRLSGNLSCLVCNAGILEIQGRLEVMDANRLERVFATNTIGHLLCMREAVKRMSLSRGGNGGTIVNVSSLAAKTGAPFEYLDYAASKAALESATVGLSKEVAGEGIRVNGVRPAFIHTDIHADGGEPERIARLRDSIPMKRGGNPWEVAEAILWLASEKSTYSTGTFIDVTGGC